MKIVSFTRLLYGSDYLGAVIKSTEDFSEQHIVMYTPVVSAGFHGTNEPCPDTRDDLMRIARSAGGRRLLWTDTTAPGFETALQMRPDADLFLELDADEIITPELADNIKADFEAGLLTAHEYRLPFFHFWRSFRYACDDSSFPIRVYIPRGKPETVFYPAEKGRVLHFGYARRLVDMQYKLLLSMHKPEFRPGWYEDVFLKFPERLTDLHPVSDNGFWNAFETEIAYNVPALINHPYRHMPKIE